MKYHGGIVIPESPAKGEKAENGLIEEAGKTIREFVCTFMSQIEGVTAQICAVNKTLMSVSKIASKGNRVVFDDDGSYIESETTGERSWLTQSSGMYYLNMWVSRKSSAEAGF